MGQFEDLTGQKFGKWTVLERGSNQGKTTCWVCKCDCGTIKEVRSSSLKDGISKSCGCLDKEGRKNCDELIGQKFGRLTVIDIVRKIVRGNTRIFCTCECECGNKIDVYKYNLLIGKTIDCGCYPKEKPCSKKTHKPHKSHARHYYSNNQVRVEGELVYVKLTNSENEMICDLDMWEKYKIHSWRESDKGYARTFIIINGKRKLFAFHRLVTGAKNGQIVDHINQNKLDNRKENLRITTLSMNAFNRKVNNESGYLGVRRLSNGKWQSSITVNYQNIGLGSYERLEDAVEARKQAELKYRGEYSKKE